MGEGNSPSGVRELGGRAEWQRLNTALTHPGTHTLAYISARLMQVGSNLRRSPLQSHPKHYSVMEVPWNSLTILEKERILNWPKSTLHHTG